MFLFIIYYKRVRSVKLKCGGEPDIWCKKMEIHVGDLDGIFVGVSV